jgi:hypothetical protein
VYKCGFVNHFKVYLHCPAFCRRKRCEPPQPPHLSSPNPSPVFHAIPDRHADFTDEFCSSIHLVTCSLLNFCRKGPDESYGHGVNDGDPRGPRTRFHTFSICADGSFQCESQPTAELGSAACLLSPCILPYIWSIHMERAVDTVRSFSFRCS